MFKCIYCKDTRKKLLEIISKANITQCISQLKESNPHRGTNFETILLIKEIWPEFRNNFSHSFFVTEPTLSELQRHFRVLLRGVKTSVFRWHRSRRVTLCHSTSEKEGGDPPAAMWHLNKRRFSKHLAQSPKKQLFWSSDRPSEEQRNLWGIQAFGFVRYDMGKEIIGVRIESIGYFYERITSKVLNTREIPQVWDLIKVLGFSVRETVIWDNRNDFVSFRLMTKTWQKMFEIQKQNIVKWQNLLCFWSHCIIAEVQV